MGRPRTQPRLQSLSPEDERVIFTATDEPFRSFLFAAIHTGLRPFCELAKLTADHVEQTSYCNGGQGCSIEVLTDLMVDTPKVAFDHYGKEWGQHYQEPLWAALGSI
jgi:hypothetical protein